MPVLSLCRRNRPRPAPLSDQPALDMDAAVRLLDAYACPTGEHDWCTDAATHYRARVIPSRCIAPDACHHYPALHCTTCAP